MAAPCSNLERVIHFLLDVCQRCEAKRSATEKTCQDYRVLLRPWPPKVDPKKKRAKQQSASDAVSKSVLQKELGQQEAEELALLDAMLHRAQKAREVQAKNEVKAKKNKTLPTKPLTKLSSSDVLSAEKAENCVLNNKPPIGSSHVATISKRTLDRLLVDTKLQRTGASSDKRTGSAASKKPTSTNKHRAPQYKNTVIKQHYKTSSSEIGKYQSKMQPATQRLPSSRSNSAEQGAAAVKRSGSLDRPEHAVCEGPQRSRSGSLTDDSGCVIQSNSVALKDSATTDVCDLVEHLQIKENQSSAPCQIDSASSGCQGDYADKDDVGEEKEDEPFTLLKDGSNLSFPVRFKKVHSANRKLKEKAASVLKKPVKKVASNHFIDRLETDFQAGSVSLSEEELVRRVDGLKSEYEHLVQITNMVLVNMNKLSEQSPWQELYQTKFLIGEIKARYYEMQEEIQHLIIGEQQLINGCPCGDCTYVQQHMNELYQKHTQHLLVPPKNFNESAIKPQNGKIVRESTEYLLYNNVEQLKKIITLEHDIVVLQLQIQLEKLVAEEVLPILQELNPNDTSYIPFYRSVYSLLHNGGRVFPAMIKDTIEEEDED
ncbi:uncharacterized protein LOC102804544 [Saccoglossus kowalevskii]|uniref:Uncharacterized protein LOC102804544 n=1 Tax=Saccoglossus kowalevskii TaxID=10224 RepID=A0ABM0N002_SACKO|nr:PREDICTED: uncharacterized protein LOC102804544 [Saccoglossus kowalevskii]